MTQTHVKSNNNIQKQPTAPQQTNPKHIIPQSQEKNNIRSTNNNSMLCAYSQQRNAPQTQAPSANVSHASSQNLLRRHGQLVSSQSSTIENFRSIENTNSMEKQGKEREMRGS